jgi:hypothetical protein
MLMMDRVVKMTETGGNFDKGYQAGRYSGRIPAAG